MVQHLQPYAVQHTEWHSVGYVCPGDAGGCSPNRTGFFEVEFLGVCVVRLGEPRGMLKADTAVVHSLHLSDQKSGELLRFSREEVGWEWMSFVVHRLVPGEALSFETRGEEMGLVFLGGQCIADWGEGKVSVGGRKNVFDGL